MKNTVIAVSLVIILALLLVVTIMKEREQPDEPTLGSGENKSEIRPQRKQLHESGPPWSRFHGGPQLMGTAECALSETLHFQWKFRTGDAVLSSAAIGRNRVYIGSNDGNLYCLDLLTGEEIWRFSSEDSIESTPCLLNGVVYVGSSDSFLYALDAEAAECVKHIETIPFRN